MKNLFLKNPSRGLMVVAMVIALLCMSSFVAHGWNQTGFGQDVNDAPQTGIDEVSDIFDLIETIFNIAFWLLIVLAAIFIIWAAFSYLTAGGDPEKVKTANHRVIYAAVAVVVAVLAKAIPSVICSFLGTSCSDPTA